MEIKEYLQQRIHSCSKYTLTSQDQKLLDKYGIKEYIFRKLMSKKFRKWSLPESVQDKIKEQINYCVSNSKPITLNLSYGGSKLWRLPTTPEVDWSEFFYIAYHVQYMSPIAKIYGPGIHLDFSSADIAMTAMNNIPREDVDQYDQSLRKLITVFTPHLPKNMTIKASRLRDLFDDEQHFIDEGEKLRKQAQQRFADDQHYADEFRRGAIQNVQLEGGTEDLLRLSGQELSKVRQRSAEIIEAMYGIPQISKEQDKRGWIFLLATNLALDDPMIVTGVTKHSSAKFWAGLGVLVRDEDVFAEYVITPGQWEQIKDNEHKTVDIDFISLKNFKQILVYSTRFDFTQ